MSFFGGGKQKVTSPRRRTSGDQPKLSKRERDELAKETNWDQKEIQALYDVYMHYQDGVNLAPVERLRDTPLTATVPLFHHALMKLNGDESGCATFPEFVRAMDGFSPRATLEEKLKLTYSLFDVSGNNSVEGEELFQMFRLILGKFAYNDGALHAIVENVMQRYPNGISYDDFVDLIDISDIDKVTLPLVEPKARK